MGGRDDDDEEEVRDVYAGYMMMMMMMMMMLLMLCGYFRERLEHSQCLYRSEEVYNYHNINTVQRQRGGRKERFY